MSRIPRPSPALVVASLALTVALSGTAVAAGIVPLAKRALSADNAKHALVADTAKKLGPLGTAELTQAATQAATEAASQAAETPGPASTAAGLVVVKTAAWSLNPRQSANFTVVCDAGQKAIGGGWSDPGDWSSRYQSLPTPDGGGWTTNLYTSSNAPSQQAGTVYAICLK